MTSTQKFTVGYLMADPGVDLGANQGSRIHVDRIIAGLRNAGHEVRLVAAQPGGTVLFDPRDGTVRTIDAHDDRPYRLTGQMWYIAEKYGFSSAELVTSDRVFRCAAEVLRGCDLLHARLAPFDLAAAAVRRELGLPLVVEANTPPLEEARHFYPHMFVHHPERLARFAASETFAQAAAIATVSRTLGNMLVSQWSIDPDKITVLPNAADLDLASASTERIQVLRQEHQLGDGHVVMFVGALQPWHDVDLLLRAFRRLSSDHSRAKLLIVGDGPERAGLEALAGELNLQQRARFTGEVSHARVGELLALADIAVAPYPPLPIAFYFSPLKLFEYMAAGKALVASRVGQIAEVVTDGKHGLLTTPGDVEGLATAISRLLDGDELRRHLGENARGKVTREHTWTRNVARLTAIYEQVLRDRQ